MRPDDDYLWTGRGAPDADTARLERALSALPGPPREPAWPPAPAPRARRWTVVAWPLAAAAALVLAWGTAGREAREHGWDVHAVAGRPSVSGWAGVFSRWTAGTELRTRAGDRARVSVGDIGWLDVEPGSVLRLVQSEQGRRRIALERGALEAMITAPPRTFVVDTPGGVATDLGCAYRLSVDAAGDGELEVTSGWVAFTHARRESFVPAGALCRTRRGAGPGTPRFADATAAFASALDSLDAAGAGAEPAVLTRVLDEARDRDAFTLWHLVPRVDGDARRRVVERLARLAPPPPEAAPQRVLQLDRAALDAWWDTFGLGSSSLFRAWEGEFPGGPVQAGG